MRIAGLGVDIADVAKMRKILAGKARGRFVENTFTRNEVECAKGGNNIAKLATNFAAKEAVYKAFGTGWIEGRDVEVLRDRETGAPGIKLHGEIGKIAKKRGIKKAMVSLSCTESAAVAVALLIS